MLAEVYQHIILTGGVIFIQLLLTFQLSVKTRVGTNLDFDLCNIGDFPAAESPSAQPLGSARSSIGAVDNSGTSGGMFSSSPSSLASGSTKEGKVGSGLGLVHVIYKTC